MSTENLEVLAPSATMSLERASIDSQVATAHAYPRSLEMFKRRATGMVTLDLETAESCIYSRPVGGGKVAEGASIRMAEIVAASYGNLRVAARIVEQTPRYVKCEGVAHDLESNYAGKSECMEPTVKQSGEPYSEGQRSVVAKACLAKAYRDAVFKVVPKALCKSILLAAEGVIRKEVATIEQRRARVQAWLKQIKVEDVRTFAVLGVKGWSEVTDEQLNMLTGLKTAINEQDTTIEEAFPTVAKKPAFEQPGAETPTPKPAPAPEPPKEEKSTPKKSAKSEPVPEPAQGDPEGDLAPLTRPVKPEDQQPAGPIPPQALVLAAEVVAFKRAEGETDDAVYERFDEVATRLLLESGVTEKQFMSFCRKNKIAKENQTKLKELTAKKVVDVAKAWSTILPEICKESA